jgi:hypothetical protein
MYMGRPKSSLVPETYGPYGRSYAQWDDGLHQVRHLPSAPLSALSLSGRPAWSSWYRIRSERGGGAGFGKPTSRAPEVVRDAVRITYVREQAAAEVYRQSLR